MSLAVFVTRARRALRKSPAHLTRRLMTEVQHEIDRFRQPRLGRLFHAGELLRRTNAPSLDALWKRLLESPFWAVDPCLMQANVYERVCPEDRSRIIAAAERAARHEIDLLGSGPVELGERIDWHRDYKTGDRWPLGYFRRIDYINRGRPSDVKTAWELSRLQWALPCAQAYVLTSDERYAAVLREILEQWIDANPYAASVNWGVTMESAMRIFAWTWMFRACGRSQAWADPGFRVKFLASIYLHGLFTERFFERSDINGNHFTADAAALVVVGSFFREGKDASRWLQSGLEDLEREIVLQVHPDGVDFEASTAYHRLCAELFLAASMASAICGRPVSATYRDRLAGMARFTAAYMRPDATAPLWGDHDDARTLPLGPQSIRDHRYLVGLIATHLCDAELLRLAGGSRVEAAWWFGTDAAARLPEVGAEPGSQAFREGGLYIMRGGGDHVFIDCGPLGLAGRGGHGHNDLLSFEALLDGVPLVTEGGCYVYTADFASRNRDRATLSHNSPIVDGEEINRFVGPEFLWFLVPDARHELVEFANTAGGIRFVGRHDGFRRLPLPVTVERTIELEWASHTLRILDRFTAEGAHTIEIPLHLCPGVTAQLEAGTGAALLRAGQRTFSLSWNAVDWDVSIEEGREAASYGSCQPIVRLLWRRTGPPRPLEICIAPIAPSSRGGA
jgi:hypothetical protein